jgi:tyrosyl-tRNA synthetase
MENVIEQLKERGLLDNITSPEVVKAVESPVTVYAGFDPTSSALQVGNLVAVMALAHFQRCGHKVIALIGGATAVIGDPSGKTGERTLLSLEEVEQNIEGVRENLGRFLDFADKSAPAKLANNNDWLKDFSFLEFLRDVGKYFRVGAMLGKESVRARLESETGMSFAEFSYQLLQAYDFLKLYDSEGCNIQVGGSDQWGNITAGIDLVRKLRGVEVFGATMPIVCDSTGQKFGKTEGNAVYLDRALTSCYAFYQFFVRTTDADVVNFLKIFTFLPLAEIAELEDRVKKAPEERAAQKRLAEEVTRMVHGEEGLATARRASEVLFGGSLEGLSAEELLSIFSDVPSEELRKDQVEDCPVVDVAAVSGLCSSKGEARRLIESGGMYVNNTRIADVLRRISSSDLVDGRVLVLRSGKKNFRLVNLT